MCATWCRAVSRTRVFCVGAGTVGVERTELARGQIDPLITSGASAVGDGFCARGRKHVVWTRRASVHAALGLVRARGACGAQVLALSSSVSSLALAAGGTSRRGLGAAVDWTKGARERAENFAKGVGRARSARPVGTGHVARQAETKLQRGCSCVKSVGVCRTRHARAVADEGLVAADAAGLARPVSGFKTSDADTVCRLRRAGKARRVRGAARARVHAWLCLVKADSTLRTRAVRAVARPARVARARVVVRNERRRARVDAPLKGRKVQVSRKGRLVATREHQQEQQKLQLHPAEQHVLPEFYIPSQSRRI